MWRASFLSSFLSSLCRVRNKIMYVLSWRIVSALTQGLFWCLFPSLLRNSGNKHQNNPLVRALKQFVTQVHTLFTIYSIIHRVWTYIILQSGMWRVSTHGLVSWTSRKTHITFVRESRRYMHWWCLIIMQSHRIPCAHHRLWPWTYVNKFYVLIR